MGSDPRESKTTVVVIICMLVFCVIVAIFSLSAERSRIEKWCTDHAVHLVDADYRAFQTGPYFKGKGESVYFVKVTRPEGPLQVYWFKFSLGGMDVTPGRPIDYEGLENAH